MVSPCNFVGIDFYSLQQCAPQHSLLRYFHYWKVSSWGPHMLCWWSNWPFGKHICQLQLLNLSTNFNSHQHFKPYGITIKVSIGCTLWSTSTNRKLCFRELHSRYLDGSVRRPTDKPVAMEMETPHSTWMTCQGQGSPGGVCAAIPYLEWKWIFKSKINTSSTDTT